MTSVAELAAVSAEADMMTVQVMHAVLTAVAAARGEQAAAVVKAMPREIPRGVVYPDSLAGAA